MIRMAWVALAALILVTSDATAQTRLRMANWLPPSHPLVAEVMVPWSKAVEEATQGRVRSRSCKRL
jgi:TRAP-type C4-dicarboxylate transport system substrate-binding protein